MKKGFTLSEVLITLGIIGIIAALTLPAIIKKYNELVTVTQLKKTYSELQQAIRMSEAYNGSFRDWDWTLDSATFANKYIMPYLGKKFSYLGYMNFICYGPNGVEQRPWTTAQYTYNNKIIAFYIVLTKTGDINDIKYVNIYVDLNGKRGQSIMGKDVFMFTLFNYTYFVGGWNGTELCPKGEHYGLYLGDIGGYWGGYCGTLEGILGEDTARGNCTSTGNGTNCGLAIEKNGWEIPENYPIKF